MLCSLVPVMIAVGLTAALAAAPVVSVEGYEVVHEYPHDAQAFTQGLVYVDGHLYESTGLNGRSSLRMVDLATGAILKNYEVPQEFFAEGLTAWGSTLVQLTWKAQKGFVYDREQFALLKTFAYEGEGWGLTHDDKRLIMSDGSAYLRFLNPKNFHETGRIRVTDSGRPVEKLNELEYIRGEIFANVWQTDRIARISPKTGKVLAWIDLSGIIDKSQLGGDAVLNGIAYDAAGNRIFVTGKLWPKLFEIKVK